MAFLYLCDSDERNRFDCLRFHLETSNFELCVRFDTNLDGAFIGVFDREAIIPCVWLGLQRTLVRIPTGGSLADLGGFMDLLPYSVTKA